MTYQENYGSQSDAAINAAMANPPPRDTCAYCGHEDWSTELYSQTRNGQTGRYCRNLNACQKRANNNRKEHPMTTFGEYTEPAQSEGDTYKPREHYGNSAIVRVLEHREEIITSNSPNGAPGVICDVYDLNLKQAFRDVLMMTGAIVDGFKPHVGRNPIVIRWEKTVARNGRDYPRPILAVPEAIKAAQELYNAGDPFAEQVGTIEPEMPF